MRTASFFTYFGPGRVSIARYAPRGMAGFKVFKPLAPGPWFNSVTREQYEELFAAQLARLDARKVWDVLHQLAGPNTEPVLLCWERPPFHERNWCHRRIVAAWLEQAIGTAIPEIVR